MLKITELKIKIINTENNSLKANASVTLNYLITINDIKLIDSNNGLFIGMPSREYTNQQGEKKYKDIVFLNEMFKTYIRNTIVDKYKEIIENSVDKQNSKDENLDVEIPF